MASVSVQVGGQYPMKRVVDAWAGRFEACKQYKEPWQAIADECEMFYSAACGFLWDPKYRARFWGNRDIDPTFRITIARAFEIVALFGPSLYWENATRNAIPNEFIQIPPELFGNVQQDPQAQQMYQQAMQQHQSEQMQRTMAAALQERILNKTPDLLGLHKHSRKGCVDLLITGRGILQTQPYRHPGSQRNLVGSFYVNPAFHYVDPDCEDADEAHYQVLERREPYWEVERRFGLYPAGVLRNAAGSESASHQGAMWGENAAVSAYGQQTGHARDMITYYEVYSRQGVGIRDMEGWIQHPYATTVERLVGDNCFLAFCPGVPYLLNCPDWAFERESAEQIKARFAWPITYWTEAKFPFSFVDAYPRKRPDGRAGYAYPLSVMAPGLGELKAMNVLICSLLYGVWMDSRTIVAVLESAKDDMEKALTSASDWAMVRLEGLNDDINKLVQYVKRQGANPDIWHIISMLAESFDRRVGVSELLYGKQGSATPRNAADVNARQANTSIRPQDLARRVADWQREVARKEAYGTWYVCQAQDLSDILGQTGAMMWDKFVKQQPGEKIIRQIDYRIEASSMQRPDLQRDGENLRNFMQAFAAPLQMTLQAGQVGPMNGLIDLFGKVTGMKVDGLKVQPPPPPPDPSQTPEAQAEQMKMQMEQQKAQTLLQLEQAKAQLQAQIDQQRAAQELQQDQQRHQQEMVQDQQVHQQEMQQLAQDTAAKSAVARTGLLQKIEEGRVKVQLAKQQAAARPKPQPSANGKGSR